MQPKSKEAAAKLKACEKMQKEAAFAQAIMTDADVPLAEEINPDEIGENRVKTVKNPLIIGASYSVSVHGK